MKTKLVCFYLIVLLLLPVQIMAIDGGHIPSNVVIAGMWDLPQYEEKFISAGADYSFDKTNWAILMDLTEFFKISDSENSIILIVDDDKENLDLLHDLLFSQGIPYDNILTVKDPTDVKEILVSTGFVPTVVLTDFSMEHMNGDQFTQMIRAGKF